MDLDSKTKSPSSPARAAGWGSRRRRRSSPKAAASRFARAAEAALRSRGRAAGAAGGDDRVLPSPPTSPPPTASKRSSRGRSRRSAASTSWSTTSASRRGAGDRRHQRRRVAGGVRSDAVSGDSRVAAGRAAHAAARRRLDRDDRVDLGPRIGRTDDVQRRESGRNQPGEGDGAAAGARQHPRQQRGAGVDSLSGGIVGSPAFRKIRTGWRNSCGGSCRSGGLAAPKRSGRSSRSSCRRARAGSAGQVCPLTAASHAPRSDLRARVFSVGVGAGATAVCRALASTRRRADDLAGNGRPGDPDANDEPFGVLVFAGFRLAGRFDEWRKNPRRRTRGSHTSIFKPPSSNYRRR